MSSPYESYPQYQPGGYGQQQPGDEQPGGYGPPPYPQGQQGPYGPYGPYPQVGWEPGQRTYLEGAPVSFGVAIMGAFRNARTYSGRASRSAFWWFQLFGVIASIVLRFIPGWAGVEDGGVGLVLFFTALSLAARRLHDADHSAYWLFLILLPVIGWIWLLVYYLQPGTPAPSRQDQHAWDRYADRM